MHSYIEFLIDKAAGIQGRVAVPDAQYDERVMEAACRVHKEGWLDVVFTGSKSAYMALANKHGFDISGIEIIDPDEYPAFTDYCQVYQRLRAKEMACW